MPWTETPIARLTVRRWQSDEEVAATRDGAREGCAGWLSRRLHREARRAGRIGLAGIVGDEGVELVAQRQRGRQVDRVQRSGPPPPPPRPPPHPHPPPAR